MGGLEPDYDSNPERFRTATRTVDLYGVAGDVHRPIAHRFRDAGARVVLDIGCGDGRLLRELRSLGIAQVGLDRSQGYWLMLRLRSCVVMPARCPFVTVLSTLRLPSTCCTISPIRSRRSLRRTGCCAQRDSSRRSLPVALTLPRRASGSPSPRRRLMPSWPRSWSDKSLVTSRSKCGTAHSFGSQTGTLWASTSLAAACQVTVRGR